jgi:hypothetical protein
MTNRDRLKEKIDYLQKVFMEDDDYDYFNEFLADRLLADKEIIVPPCKVGDMVYEIQPIREMVQAYEITTIMYNGHYWWFTWILKDHKGIYGNVEGFSSHQIGKTVFLTEEEAEQALKEKENG